MLVAAVWCGCAGEIPPAVAAETGSSQSDPAAEIAHGKTLPAYRSGDAAGFNGIYLRWLAQFVEDDHLWPQYYQWMLLNANAAWNVRRDDNLSWQKWNQRTPNTTLDSWNCSDTVVILQVVPAKEPADK